MFVDKHTCLHTCAPTRMQTHMYTYPTRIHMERIKRYQQKKSTGWLIQKFNNSLWKAICWISVLLKLKLNCCSGRLYWPRVGCSKHQTQDLRGTAAQTGHGDLIQVTEGNPRDGLKTAGASVVMKTSLSILKSTTLTLVQLLKKESVAPTALKFRQLWEALVIHLLPPSSDPSTECCYLWPKPPSACCIVSETPTWLNCFTPDSTIPSRESGHWLNVYLQHRVHPAALVLLLWRDTTTKATLRKESIYWRLAYSFRGLVHYQHCRKQKGIALEQ